MSAQDQQIEHIELTIEQAKKTVAKAEALQRLQGNKDFTELFTEGYMKDEAVRLVHAKAGPAAQDPEMQKAIMRDLDSIGSLVQYFNTINALANQALGAIEANEQALEEIHAEGDE